MSVTWKGSAGQPCQVGLQDKNSYFSLTGGYIKSGIQMGMHTPEIKTKDSWLNLRGRSRTSVEPGNWLRITGVINTRQQHLPWVGHYSHVIDEDSGPLRFYASHPKRRELIVVDSRQQQ